MEINKVICGDSLEYMKTLPDKCIDLVLTDPPYWIWFDNKIRDNKINNWDISIPEDEYFKEIFRISRNQIIWWWNYFPYLWKEWCRWFIFWNKDVNMDTYSAWELAWTSFNTPAKYFYWAWNWLADGIRGRNKKEKIDHPTVKPKELFKWCLENYSKPWDIILDCFAWSWTTAIASIETWRNYIVIEKEPKYVKIIEKRIKNTTPPLFVI